jgi:hypothetical protein
MSVEPSVDSDTNGCTVRVNRLVAHQEARDANTLAGKLTPTTRLVAF